MIMKNALSGTVRCVRLAFLALIAVALPMARSATIWNGPNITWTKSGSTPSDTIIPGKVVLTRGGRDVLYNTAAGESFANGISSPKDTEWAFGSIANATSLSYQSLDSMRNGFLAGILVGNQMVMHVISQDIYISITFTVWGSHGAGTVSYTRSTAPAAATPSVTITNLASNAVFAAPASITLKSSATVTGGTVTNVEYFASNTSLGHATTAPFTVAASIPNAGSYTITAKATAAGVTGTSPGIPITVVTPADVNLSAFSVANGQFTFNYSGNTGLRYVVEKSADLNSSVWTPVVTNSASASESTFSEAFSAATPAALYRVGRMPNP